MRRGELAQQELKYDEAEAHYRDALAVVEQIERTDAEKDRTKGNRALVLMKLGGLEQARATEPARRGDPAVGDRLSAAAHLRVAVGLREQVVRNPASGKVDPALARRDLGWAHVILAAALTAQQDRPAALASAREGWALLERALGELPEEPRKARGVRNHAGRAAFELARALGPDGTEAEVRAAYQRAVDLFRQLIADSPRDSGARVNLSAAASEFGDALLIRWNRPQEALEMFALARAENRALTTGPELVNLRRVGVALGYYRLGVAAQRAGKAADAQKHFERCLGLRELRVHQLEDDTILPKNATPTVNAKIDRMLAQARVAGKADDAAKTAEGVLKLCEILTVPADAVQAAVVVQRAHRRILAACGLALASDAVPPGDPRRADYRAKPLNAVRLAIADGYMNRLFLETDPDLDPLRNDPQFRRLVAPVTGAAD